jgi:hypothetical protein
MRSYLRHVIRLSFGLMITSAAGCATLPSIDSPIDNIPVHEIVMRVKCELFTAVRSELEDALIKGAGDPKLSQDPPPSEARGEAESVQDKETNKPPPSLEGEGVSTPGQPPPAARTKPKTTSKWEVGPYYFKSSSPYYFLTTWVAAVDLTLIVNSQSGVTPGVSLINPLAQVVDKVRGTFPQSFTLGVGGTLNGQANRTEPLVLCSHSVRCGMNYNIKVSNADCTKIAMLRIQETSVEA